MIEEFERHLRGTNLSENTISSYLFALRQYSSQYDCNRRWAAAADAVTNGRPAAQRPPCF